MMGFIIAGLLVGIYALILYRVISRIDSMLKFSVPLCMTLFVSAFDILMTFLISFSGKDILIFLPDFAFYKVILILGNLFSLGIITPLLIFENYLPREYLNVIIVIWSLILTPALLANIEINSSKFDFFQLFSIDTLKAIVADYKFTLLLLLNYLEIAGISAIFYRIISIFHIKLNPEWRGVK